MSSSKASIVPREYGTAGGRKREMHGIAKTIPGAGGPRGIEITRQCDTDMTRSELRYMIVMLNV